ncbi:hypothetical protein WMY93_010023 [Mugilogobius chulae]|uniref:Lipase maturation factor n=1 Tax=Mugilogobius chulae TaxID=88201 RepID=A0AAW0PF59_9GOBI
MRQVTLGLIKIRGDKCWLELTCMDYHYETQPVPNPMSYYLHRSPWWFHRLKLCPTTSSSSSCHSSPSWAEGCAWSTGYYRSYFRYADSQSGEHLSGHSDCFLSVPVVMNLVSSRQVMNTSFDPLRIVNTYGAFGRVLWLQTPKTPAPCGRSTSSSVNPETSQTPMCHLTYHYRLDWLMWFAAFQTYEQNEWVIHIAGRLLSNDSMVLSLMEHNPFEGRATPANQRLFSVSLFPKQIEREREREIFKVKMWVRGEHYIYKFSRPGSTSAAQGKWWVRRRIGPYFPPVDLEGLRGYFQSRNWPLPHGPRHRS